MIVEFDIDIGWTPVPASFSNSTGRLCSSAPNHCLLLTVREEVVDAIDGIEGNLYHTTESRRYDCSVGDHDGTEWPEFVLPKHTGYTHSKLTVRGIAPADAPVEMKLSEILEGSPVPGVNAGERKPIIGDALPVQLTPKLAQMVRELAYRYQGDHPRAISDFIAMALLEKVEDLH